MKSIHTAKSVALGLALSGVMFVGAADAATSIKGDNFPFNKDNATQTLNVRGDSFYNLTMGYKGWTHHSAWMYMNLQKGKLYTITATADKLAYGLHPGVACWHRPQGQGLVSNQYAYDHFYNQFTSIMAKNVVDEADQKKLGTMKMYFELNGYDRDGMENPLPEEYQQGPVVGILDGTIGKVELSFIPKNSGNYQCVVGGINPDPSLSTSTKYPVSVSVGGF